MRSRRSREQDIEREQIERVNVHIYDDEVSFSRSLRCTLMFFSR